MSIIAVIPARGGSKRIPRKNIRDFCGKPLISYPIQTALSSGLFDRVMVSTDDKEIAEISKACGAEVPFVRPAELADDFTPASAVSEHAVDWLRSKGEDVSYVCTIYATAPLLQEKYLAEGLTLLKNSDAVHAFSVTSMPFPVHRTFEITPDNRCRMFWPEYFTARSQDLPEAYQDAGQFYWTRTGRKSCEMMFGRDSIPVVLPRHLVQDIDTPEDWERAEILYRLLQAGQK